MKSLTRSAWLKRSDGIVSLWDRGRLAFYERDNYIHGNGASSDWTWGCVALENEDIEELYQAIPVGTPVTIKP